MDFKLIAIRALENCSKDFRKNLKEGYFYKLYNQYLLIDDHGKEVKSKGKVVSIRAIESPCENLYEVQTKDGRTLDINISAIVGMNGAGKSTLTEIFFATLYMFSIRSSLLFPNEESLLIELNNITSGLSANRKDNGRKTYGRIMRMVNGNRVHQFEALRAMFKSYEEELKTEFDYIKNAERRRAEIVRELKELERLSTELKTKIIFKISKTYISLQVDSDFHKGYEISIIDSEKEDDKLILEFIDEVKKGVFSDQTFLSGLFFYTVAINYSNYSLNSDFIGEWIKWLFHKNEEYKSPVVLNPMRTRGEFDIAKENRFAKYRLLSNLLSARKDAGDEMKFFLTQYQFVKHIRFTLNYKKITKYTIDDKGRNIKANKVEIAIVEGLYATYFSGSYEGEIRIWLGKIFLC